MSDSQRRYLAIQRELGGNEVILSAPLDAQRDQGTEGQRDSQRGGGTEGQAAEGQRERGTEGQKGNAADWRKNAPPIPSIPGLSVVAPPRGLMDGPPEWDTLDQVHRAIAVCRLCFLCEGRKHTVPGEGHPRAELMFVGEGPGQVEDETGRPFVGRAGELLTQIIEAVGLRREDVFIANAVKCRPPQNRKPLPDELAACWRYLERQIELIRPKVIVALGATAAETLLQVRRSLAELRGRVHSYRGIPLVVTYHPAALLRNPNWKKPTWDDIRIARQLLDR